MSRLSVKLHRQYYSEDRYKPPAYQQEATFSFDPPVTSVAHKDFEHQVAALIERMTGHKAEVVGGARDGGIDIKVYDQGRLVGVVQCKRYAPNQTLPPGYIRELQTVKHQAGVRTAYLVTTARFSESSYQLAAELGIKLIDGSTLERMQSRAGVRPQPATAYRRPKTWDEL